MALVKVKQDVISDTVNLGRRNLIINGNFDVWQRGTTATYTTNSSKFITDRWMIRSTGVATVTSSQQSFTVGQTDVPNNPKYYYRWDITSYTSGTGLFHQRLEDVAKHSGQTLTFSFWAKCNSSQNLITSYRQYFGSGGSAAVDTSGSTFALTTSWQKFTETVNIPSASGKTISGGDDHLYVQFNMPGTVCTVDIAQCQLEVGKTATPFERLSYSEELALCQRYCFQLDGQDYAVMGIKDQSLECIFPFPTTMRAQPTVHWSGTLSDYTIRSVGTDYTPTSFSQLGIRDYHYGWVRITNSSVGATGYVSGNADGFVRFDSEL